MQDRDSERVLLARIIAQRPFGATARRVAAYGMERELDLWRLQRAMANVHDVDLRRWSKRDRRFVELVMTARRDLWRAYLAGYDSGINGGGEDDQEPADGPEFGDADGDGDSDISGVAAG
jgi:hypothetical protein